MSFGQLSTWCPGYGGLPKTVCLIVSHLWGPEVHPPLVREPYAEEVSPVWAAHISCLLWGHWGGAGAGHAHQH